MSDELLRVAGFLLLLTAPVWANAVGWLETRTELRQTRADRDGYAEALHRHHARDGRGRYLPATPPVGSVDQHEIERELWAAYPVPGLEPPR